MDLDLLARVLRRRAELARHDRWTRAELEDHQQRALAVLRRHATARSPFYGRRHRGLADLPLDALPSVSKAELMELFDEVLTTRRLSRNVIEARLRGLADSGGDPGAPLDGRWWTAATAGTTGRRGVFVWDRAEWATILASYARAMQWVQVRAGLTHPLRMAVVSSLVPTHQSAVVGASLRSRTVPTLRLDARAPLQESVEALNAFGPRVLVGYPSSLRPLAFEQTAGRLHITPEAVMSASEVLAEPAARDMKRAWGSWPHDVYAATETAGISSPCRLGLRHLYEDLVVAEPVDKDGALVEPGSPGTRLLVTVLFSRTVPLIRYELSDRVTLSPEHCGCGLPFRVLEAVEGREQDVLSLPGPSGPLSIHPGVFHAVLDDVDAAAWQVVQHGESDLRVLVVPTNSPLSSEHVRTAVDDALRAAGAAVSVSIELVDQIPRTALGKAPLIRHVPD